MKRRNVFKLPNEINLQVTQIIYYKIANKEIFEINFQLENYEDELHFITSKEPIEKRLFEIAVVEDSQLAIIYSNKSSKDSKQRIKKERVDEIKAKILESIEGNDEFAEHKLDLLLLLS
ncbi:hypothetical protein COA01_15870 [Bacillus cereus]|uniref:hypothetical protein n=1 Tax=Bacillus cereus TaxID=1396 RepID=UPI000BFBAB57|nr:hypothetical protein [Bacillus cereus]PGP21015.1 hypothetical protein COA01_15870 [Bacillus cereus]